jgi:3-methyladenine DNA glycosylase AlkD
MTRARTTPSSPDLDPLVQQALASLEQMSTRKDRDNLKRFGITAEKAFGVSMANIQRLAKRLGRDHDLAAALWDTEWYEARLLTSFVDDPARVTSAQMDRWCRDFDNWGICDTVCFFLFDRTPFAWDKVAKWSDARPEFVKRAAFALLASLAGHDKETGDDRFLHSLGLIERAATDDRNFVKKAVSWALRRTGGRSLALNSASIALARRLSESSEPSARWIGMEALRDFKRPAARQRLARTSRAPARSTTGGKRKTARGDGSRGSR